MDVVEPRPLGLALGLVDGAAYWSNGVLARGPRPQLVAVLRDAARAYVTTGQEPRTLEHDPCPPVAGLWWTFDRARGGWMQSSPGGTRYVGSGLELLAVFNVLA